MGGWTMWPNTRDGEGEEGHVGNEVIYGTYRGRPAELERKSEVCICRNYDREGTKTHLTIEQFLRTKVADLRGGMISNPPTHPPLRR